MEKKKISTKTLTLGAVLTAVVIVLQSLGTYYTAFFGPFSTAMALIPIVIGAAMCGKAMGAWLGLAFAGTVLFTGGAVFFQNYNFWGTVVTVIAKGVACGFAAGLVYQLLKKFNEYVAVFSAAAICPIVNTGVFLLGSRIFFLQYADEMVKSLPAAFEKGLTGMQVFVFLAMANFLTEFFTSLLLSPAIVKILSIKRKMR